MSDPDDLAHLRMYRLLRSMPRTTLRLFIAHRVEELSYAEIAEREHMPVWRVKRHMLRAIRIIARQIEAD